MKTPYFSFLSKTEIPFPYDWIDTLLNTFLSRMRWSNTTLKKTYNPLVKPKIHNFSNGFHEMGS